jgi:1-acyl-sn-glycerol-3-phosphate acyltransferase
VEKVVHGREKLMRDETRTPTARRRPKKRAAAPASVAELARHRPPPAPEEEPAGPLDTSLGTLSGLAGSLAGRFVPGFVQALDLEVRRRIAAAPMELNGYGYDPWGFDREVACRATFVSALLYRYYFRVKTYGIDRLPRGRILLIANHAGQIAIDAAMIGVATILEANPPRIVRGMGEYWLPTIPFFNVLMARVGSVVGTPKNCIDLLEHGEAVIAFPEGVRGMNKAWAQRYRLQQFGLGFMRLALETGTPIVPIAVVGSEEQAPSLGSFEPLARLLRMPAFPLVLTPVPLPVRYHIYFGEPMEFRGNPNDEDQVVEKRVEQVKARIREMIEKGLRSRRSVFR